MYVRWSFKKGMIKKNSIFYMQTGGKVWKLCLFSVKWKRFMHIIRMYLLKLQATRKCVKIVDKIHQSEWNIFQFYCNIERTFSLYFFFFRSYYFFFFQRHHLSTYKTVTKCSIKMPLKVICLNELPSTILALNST